MDVVLQSNGHLLECTLELVNVGVGGDVGKVVQHSRKKHLVKPGVTASASVRLVPPGKLQVLALKVFRKKLSVVDCMILS